MGFVFVKSAAVLNRQNHFHYAVKVGLVPVAHESRAEGAVKLANRDGVGVVDPGVRVDDV